MRFGKKSRNLAAASRHVNGERPQQDRQAAGLTVQVLESIDDEENVMTPPQPEESMVAGDPTQRLLTALGRFQRQVTRAEEGAPQDSWCDECMNQLIIGIEIALNEDWADVKEALTDAARILQTYEDAGRAEQCVRFLKDSYEILCLMVGDLIVGNVRSGVMKKWQERYERALDELAEAGLTLVDDDGPTERDTARTARNESVVAKDEFDTTNDSGPAPDSIFDSGQAGPERAFRTDPGDPFAPMDVDSEEESDSSPFGSSDAFQPAATSATDDVPSLDELLGRPVSPDDDLDDDEEAPALEPELSDDFTAEVQPEQAALEDEPEVDEGLEVDEEFDVDEVLGTDDREDAAPTFEQQTDPVEPTSDSGELDFGDSPALEDVQDESTLEEEDAAVTEEIAAPPAVVADVAKVAVPEPEPEPEPEPGSPEALWRTAQVAMKAGNVADAKLFALQLAANMAKLEAGQVENNIALIEKDIEDNSEAVTAAELAVNEAEERVKKLEEDAAHCQQEFEQKQQHIGSIREEVAAAESSVEDLNRQIAELEARRNEEAERLAGCQKNLEDNLSEERRMQAELDSLQEEESGSRENLEGAREHVRSLQESGANHAAKLESTQVELEKRRKSVEDIELTIRQVSGAPEAGGEEAQPDETAAENGGEPGESGQE